MPKKRQRYYSDSESSNDEFVDRKKKMNKLDYGSHSKTLDEQGSLYENYKNLLSAVYFSESDPITTDSPDYEDFWKFLQKYQRFQQKEKLKVSGYDRTNKNNLMFSHKCDKAKIFLSKQNISGKSRFLTAEELEIFESVLLLYYDFLQKQKFNKLRKIRQDQMNLPIYKYKNGIIESINKNQVVVVAGDTGCGKSTQIPQYLMEAGYSKIACTQPRRIACISLAKRVSHETLNEFGSSVAYQVRFDRTKTKATRILFLTEGLLLRQIDNDPTLSKYDVIIMDEVHERHVHTDFLLGVVKCVLHQRKDLKLILMSATINLELFSRYFDNAPVAKVPGRLYPIQLNYQPIEKIDKDVKGDKFDPSPYIRVLESIDRKYQPNDRGDVLVFLSGLTEIMALVEASREYGKKSASWIILPLHSSLSLAEQDKVFDYPPDGVRKCIISTNIAETSVTIDGVRFVIDSGKVKEMAHDSGVKMGCLKEAWISRASAEQRKGRAGRTGPGVCFRLYREEDYTAMEEYSTPEIRRVPLESLVLQMVVLGIPDPRLFPFIEPPSVEKLEGAIKLLKSQGALTESEEVTQIGKTLAKLPVDVMMGKMLISGCLFEAVDPILSMAASLCVQSVFTNKAHRDFDAYKLRKCLESNHGDPLTLLSIFEAWLEMKSTGEETRRWCRKRGVEEQRLYEIVKLRMQFRQLLTDNGLLDDERDSDEEENNALDSIKRRQRHADRNQLKKLRKEHRNKDRKKKILRMTDGAEEEDDAVDERTKVVGDVQGDIRDLEFRLTNDMEKIQNLLADSRRAASTDTSLLKVIICNALHPQFALSDEHNSFKPDSQQFYHTPLKSFITLHPTSVLTSDPEQLVIRDVEIKDGPKRAGSYHKGKLSYNHQILAYVTLLETNKPYLINALRVPAFQSLLLFSNKIDTTSDLHRFVFDSWIDIEVDKYEDAFTVVASAIRIRTLWQKLLEHKLHLSEQKTSSAPEEEEEDDAPASRKRIDRWRRNRKKCRRAENKLTRRLNEELRSFLRLKVYYRIRKLHVAETKTLYRRGGFYSDEAKLAFGPDDKAVDDIDLTKGGFKVTEYMTYDCIDDDSGFPTSPESSPLPCSNEYEDAYCDEPIRKKMSALPQKFEREDWVCSTCDASFLFTTAEKLRHVQLCEAELSASILGPEKKDGEEDDPPTKTTTANSTNSGVCESCGSELKGSIAEIIAHARACRRRADGTS